MVSRSLGSNHVGSGLSEPLAVADYANAKGPKSVGIAYEIRKNGDTVPGPTTPFRVDFSVTGPSNPGIPGSINTRLIPASFRGTDAAAANIMEFAQAGKPVTVTVELWRTSDPAELPAPGMFLILVNPDGTFIAPAKEISNEIPGDFVTWDIDWSVFQKLGNGRHNISYVVSPTATPTSATNLNRALPREVEVRDAVTTLLPAAKYVNATGGVWSMGLPSASSTGADKLGRQGSCGSGPENGGWSATDLGTAGVQTSHGHTSAF